MRKPAFVRGEKLVVVRDGAPWWLALLRAGDARIFDAGGRVEETGEAEAPGAVQRARAGGFNPIVLCPSAAARARIVARLPAASRRMTLLAQGEDDAAIRDLLVHPSREALLGWSGQVPLVLPTRAYEDALRDWLAHDRVSSAFIRRVQAADLRIEDFALLDVPDFDPDAPLLRYRFEWRLAPWRELLLYVYPRDREAVLGQANEGDPARAVLRLDAGQVSFDERGEAPVGGALMQQLCSRFDLPTALHDWSAAQGAALPSSTLVDAVRTWLAARHGSFDDPHDAATWRRCAAAIARDGWLRARRSAATTLSGLADLLAGPPPRALRLRGATELSADDLATPLLQLRIDAGGDAAALAVDWSPTEPERDVVPREAPLVTVEVDDVQPPVTIEWGARFAELRLTGLTLSPTCEYRWSWDGTTNRLTIRFVRED